MSVYCSFMEKCILLYMTFNEINCLLKSGQVLVNINYCLRVMDSRLDSFSCRHHRLITKHKGMEDWVLNIREHHKRSFSSNRDAISWHFMWFCIGQLSILYRAESVLASAQQRSACHIKRYNGKLRVDMPRIFESLYLKKT